MSPSAVVKLVIGFIVGVILLVTVSRTMGVVKVEGDEAVVQQDWSKGVLPDVLLSGTHFYVGWTTDVYKYQIGTQKITFDKGAEYDRIVVNVGENGGQEAHIAMSVNYRLGWIDSGAGPAFSPEKLIRIHKDGIGKTYEDVIVRRTIVDAVNKVARPYDALRIYSGTGFVKFKEEVEKELKNHPVFKDRGIYIENLIINKVYLDPAYESEIAGKQLAIQQTLRKKEETKAAEEEAKRAFAQAQAQVEVTRQRAEAEKIITVKKAEADKAQAILRAEGEKEQQVLQAEGEKQKRILEAEGNRDANLAIASGILAVGKSEAEVEQLKRDAKYDGISGERRANVEIATAQAEKARGMLQGVSVIPERTIYNMGMKTMGLAVSDDPSQKW